MADTSSPEVRIASLEGVVNTRFPQLEKTTKLLKKRVDALEACSNESNSKVAVLDTQLEKLPVIEDTVNAIELKLEKIHKMMRSVEDSMVDYQSRLEALENTVSPEHKEEMAFLHKKIEEHSDTCGTLMKAVAGEGSTFGRKVRAPPPRSYGGARDSKEVDNFIFDVEQYFRVNKFDEDSKLDTAAMYLTDDAKLWWRSKYAEKEAGRIILETWDDFKKVFKEQFYPENTEFLARRKLLTIKHSGSIRDYVKAFAACILQIPEMPEKDRVFTFINGLQSWAQREMMRQQYETLSSALIAAERLVDYHSERESAPRRAPFVANSGNSSKPAGSAPANSTSNNFNRFRAGGDQNRRWSPGNSNNNSSARSTSSEVSTSRKPFGCFLCKGPHRMSECPHQGEFNTLKKNIANMSLENNGEGSSGTMEGGGPNPQPDHEEQPM